jgi:hypothetical protein
LPGITPFHLFDLFHTGLKKQDSVSGWNLAKHLKVLAVDRPEDPRTEN